MRKWDKESIQNLLDNSNKAVERALLVIYSRQTFAEQSCERTEERNTVGFSAFDAEFLTSCAKGLMRYGKLTETQIPLVHKKIRKYWRQLAEIANGG